jgi:hypothetical protein
MEKPSSLETYGILIGFAVGVIVGMLLFIVLESTL